MGTVIFTVLFTHWGKQPMLRNVRNEAGVAPSQALPESSPTESLVSNRSLTDALVNLVGEVCETLKAYRGYKLRTPEMNPPPLSPELKTQNDEIAKLDHERRKLEIEARISKLKVEIAENEERQKTVRNGGLHSKEQNRYGNKASAPKGSNVAKSGVNPQVKPVQPMDAKFNGIKGMDKLTPAVQSQPQPVQPQSDNSSSAPEPTQNA